MSTLTPTEFSYYTPEAPLFGFMGAAIALIFSNIGAAYGTGKSGMGISALGVTKPELVMKSIVPVRSSKQQFRIFTHVSQFQRWCECEGSVREASVSCFLLA